MGFKFERLSILVVEDTEAMQKLVVSVLETLGVGEIFVADDGESGFQSFCKQSPDIILLDWHMEPMDGLKMLELVRRNAKSPNRTVPVIMMTGYNAMSRVATARDQGITELLVKPFSANDLARRIAYVINKPRDFIESQKYFGPDRRRRSSDNYKGPERRRGD